MKKWHELSDYNSLVKGCISNLFRELPIANHHLLKWDYQPQKRSRSWQNTIDRERDNIELYLEDSPSLRRYLNNGASIAKMYRLARADAIRETDLDFPKDCPYSMEDVLDRVILLAE